MIRIRRQGKPGGGSPPSGYPANAPGYPGSTPGYPGNAPGYPGNTPGYPANAPGYPGNAPGYPGNAPGYPGNTPGYGAEYGSPAGEIIKEPVKTPSGFPQVLRRESLKYCNITNYDQAILPTKYKPPPESRRQGAHYA